MLKEIYINLVDQKEPKLNLKSVGILDSKFKDNPIEKNNKLRKIVKPSGVELELHRDYLKYNLQKNYYN